MCLLRMTPSEKDLEILFLKQQLLIVRRRQKRCARLGRWEKFILVSLWEQIHSRYQIQKVGLHQISMLFKPDTLLRWHRDLVKKKWTFDTTAKRRGRPSVSLEIEQLVVKFANENDWGAGKIEGELQKLGYRICKQTVLNILKRQGISPLPQRDRTSNWRSFIKHYHKTLLACDFLTVETLWLQTLYVFFIIEVGTRRVYIGGVTTHATGQWVTSKHDSSIGNLKMLNYTLPI